MKGAPPAAAEAPGIAKTRLFLVCAGLVAINLAAYASVGHLGFVDYDDSEYVAANSHIANGLTLSSIKWALTTGYFANWHPLTWLSHLLDVQLFGVNAGPHHIVNLLIHMIGTLSVFGALRGLTNDDWRSALVAALFAVHPLHVESVAWLAERKDVLSTVFWMLTLWAYAGYARRPGWRRYSAVAAFMALGLMAKPMLVTVPVVLLLLDYWPLRREMRLGLFTEKLPLFGLAALSSLITVLVQRQAGAVMQLDQVPLTLRVANAVVSYVRYIGKMIWPTDLVAMYPLPREISPALVIGALAIVAGITLGVLLNARRRPYLAVGWLWYMITLLPVIGIVQVGAQAMADRYTYIPLIGLFIMIAWAIPDAVAATTPRLVALGLASGAVILACTTLSFRQVQVWRDNVALWQHAVDVTPTNYFAQGSLGYALWKGGKTDEAMPHYTEALRLRPDFAEGHNNLGVALAGQGQLHEAVSHFAEAVRLKPGYEAAQQNMNATSARERAVDNELERYVAAVRERPNDLVAQNELGAALSARGRIDEAIVAFKDALRIDPTQPDVLYNLAMMLDKKGRTAEAMEELRAALRSNPKHEAARQALDAMIRRTTAGVRK